MSVLESVLIEEYKRLLEKRDFYQNKLESLPKGSIFIQTISKERFVYRKKRVGKKIISEYIGKLGSIKAKNAIESYKEYKTMKDNIKIVMKDILVLKRIVKNYERKSNSN